MKTSLIPATVVAILLTLLTAATLSAQPRNPPPSQGAPNSAGVAVIDMDHVVMNYVRAKQARESMKRDTEAAQSALKKEATKIDELQEKLKDFRPGTPDYKRLEEDVTQRTADIKVKASIAQKEFMERSAKAMYLMYREISEEVKRYSLANNIGLVLPYNSEPVDANVPSTIQKALSNPFVYQGGPDITEFVLQELNRRALMSNKPNGPGGSQTPIRK